jgi:DNA adenine methylase
VRKAIPWVGGKASLAKRIVALISPHTCYVEAFAGGAAVFFAKPRSAVEVLNDRNVGLITLFRVWQRHPEAFLKELGLGVSSREWYEDCWAQPGLTDVERAVRFYYRIRHTFCAKVAEKSFGYGTTRGGISAESVREDVLRVHERLNRVYLENLSFESVFARYERPHTFFYCDPPYYKVSKLYGPGLDFEVVDHERLAGLLKGLKGAFLLSLNDHPEVRALYAWASQRKVKAMYSLGSNAAGSVGKAKSHGELLITNRPWVD